MAAGATSGLALGTIVARRDRVGAAHRAQHVRRPAGGAARLVVRAGGVRHGAAAAGADHRGGRRGRRQPAAGAPGHAVAGPLRPAGAGVAGALHGRGRGHGADGRAAAERGVRAGPLDAQHRRRLDAGGGVRRGRAAAARALPRGAVPGGRRLLGARGGAAAHPARRPGGPGAGPGGAPHPPGQPAAPGLAGAAAALPLLVGPERADRRLRGALHPLRGPAGRLPARGDGRRDAGRRHRGGPVRPAPRAGPAGQPAAVPAGRPVPGLLVAAVDLGGDGARAGRRDRVRRQPPAAGAAGRPHAGRHPRAGARPPGRRAAGRVRRSARCWPAPRPT